MLSVCSSATSTDGSLTTTTVLRTLVSGLSTGDDLSQHAALIAASRWTEAEIGLPPGHLQVQVYSENLPAFGGQTLLLSRRPVLNVLRLWNGATSSGSATIYTSTQYRLDGEAGLLWMDAGFPWTAQQPYVLGPTIPPESELQPWYVEYAAGYRTVSGTMATCGTCSTSTGQTLPQDVEMAVCLKARELYEGSYGIQSQKIGDLSITRSCGSGMSEAAACLLAPYRRISLGGY